MSVGLSDLNKKRKMHQPSTATSSVITSVYDMTPEAGVESEAQGETPSTHEQPAPAFEKMKSVYKKSATARPWTDGGFVKAPTRSRPRVSHGDLSVNDEWMSLQTEPIFWIDFQQHSFLLQLNERLCAFESKVDELLLSPLRAIGSFFKPRGTNQA